MECEPLGEEHSEPKTLGEYLDECCEYYMALGVPYDVFWYGDYCCLKYYEAVNLKQRKMQNEDRWMQGFYNYVAVSTSLSNAFRGKGTPAQNYLEKPMDFFPKTEEEEKAEAERIKRRIIENLNTLKQNWESKNNGNVSGNCESPDQNS